MNNVSIMGRFCYDHDINATKNGKKVLNNVVAVPREYLNADGEREADFIHITAYGNTADFLEKYFVKGSLVAIEGTINSSSWEDDKGEKRRSTYITVRNVSFTGELQTEQKPKNRRYNRR
jgi:single-strand DNA-binding protein